ncbi:hypothetical protein [Mycobacteroides abscessus]|uniref:hypothetical protein n=1 Tax=Mycobacteroides abscessus TaxID=36809 RepID=UPI0009A9223D
MIHRNPVPAQRVGGVRTAIMRHAAWTVSFIALIYALAMLAGHQYGAFAVQMALVLAASAIDLWVHRRGRYRDRSAVLLFIAVVAIVVMGVFAQVGVSA